jgi:UDP-N-acetyl-D-galactosamine dehydrogenase
VFTPYFWGADPTEVKHEYEMNTITKYPEGAAPSPVEGGYSAIILAVAHKEFLQIDLMEHKKSGAIIYDVKGIPEPIGVDGRL